MKPCRHIQPLGACAIGRPLDCACRAYDPHPAPTSEIVSAWVAVEPKREWRLYEITVAAVSGAIVAVIGLAVLVMGGLV